MSIENDVKGNLNLTPTLKRRENYPPLDNVDNMFKEQMKGKSGIEMAEAIQGKLNEYKERQLQPGEEPNTKSALGIDFEETGIPPAGWGNVCPYDTKKFPLTQIGMSNLFAEWVKGMGWFDPTTKNWYIRWDKRIVLDTNHKLMCWLRNQFQEAVEYAASRIQNSSFKKKFQDQRGKWFVSDAKWDKVLAGAQPYCSVDSATKDTDRYVIATPGKIIKMNRKDGSIFVRDMDKMDFIVKHLGVEYDPNATCPTFLKLLESSLEGDIEKIKLLQMLMGLVICGNNEQRSVVIFYGPGTSNGKSTILKVLTDVLGDYAAGVREVAVDGTHEGNGASSDLIAIKGKRMVGVREVSQSMRLNAAKVKRITSNDIVTGREVFQGTESFIPQCVLFMDCNALPEISDLSLFDRKSIILITFNKSFQGKEQDTSIAGKLEKEHAGILNWMLEGFTLYCKAYPENTQFVLPKNVWEDTLAYRDEFDKTKRFAQSKLEYTGDFKDYIERKDMYACYEGWARELGEQPDSPHVFNVGLRKVFNITGKIVFKSHNRELYRGFRFKSEDCADPSGFSDYLETEYQKTNTSKKLLSGVPAEVLFTRYLAWADQQGIADVLNVNGIVAHLVKNHYNFDCQNGTLIITDIRKVVSDKDMDCRTNQLTM